MRLVFSITRVISCIFIAFSSINVMASLQNIQDAAIATHLKRTIVVNADNSQDITSEVTYKVLTEQGVQDLPEMITFDYSTFDTFELQTMEYQQPEADKMLAVSADMIDKQMAPNEASALSSNVRVSVNIPAIKIGTTIHYVTKEHHRAEDYLPVFFETWQKGLSAQRFDKLEVEYITQQPIIWKAANFDDFMVTQSKDKKTLKFSLKKAPYFKNFINEELGNLWLERPRIDLAHSLDLNTNYQALGQRYVQILAQTLPTSLQQVVKTNTALTEREKINSFMQYIYNNFRYVGDWRSIDSGSITFDLQQIVDSGYGDCKNLSVILVAMLRAANIKAEPVFVYRGYYTYPALLSGHLNINHAIVRAELQTGEVVWLDPTNSVFNIDRPLDDITNRQVIVIQQDGSVRHDFIPNNSAAINFVTIQLKPNKYSEQADLKLKFTTNVENMDFNKLEREDGKEATDKAFCRNLATHQPLLSTCKVTRPTSEYLLKPDHQVTIAVTDAKALQEIAPKTYVLNEPEELDFWDSFLRYKNNNNLLDLQRPITQDNATLTIIGHKSEQNQHCEVKSKWFNVGINKKAINNNTEISYYRHWLAPILTHKEIISPEFQQKITEAKRCALNSNVLIEE